MGTLNGLCPLKDETIVRLWMIKHPEGAALLIAISRNPEYTEKSPWLSHKVVPAFQIKEKLVLYLALNW